MDKQKVTVKSELGYAERDAALTELGFSNYSEYLNSELWKIVRRMAFSRKKNKKCKVCGQPTEVLHHTRYDVNTLRGRSLQNLMPLCRKHHEMIEKDGERKTALREANDRLQLMRDSLVDNRVASRVADVPVGTPCEVKRPGGFWQTYRTTRLVRLTKFRMTKDRKAVHGFFGDWQILVKCEYVTFTSPDR